MRLLWQFDHSDIQAVQDIIEQQKDRAIVRERIRRNVSDPVPKVNNESVWQSLIMCSLTSQQRSGPNSSVSRFLLQDPSPISIEACRSQMDLEKYIYRLLKDFGGIRFPESISKRLAVNYEYLESGGWLDAFEFVDKLVLQRKETPTPQHHKLEREAALFMKDHFKGIGPKQSRNFWQYLGLCRYEFVLDSRIVRWLNSLDFPFPLSSIALGDEAYYVYISDILRELCIKSSVLPCILDAAVFTSFDLDEWQEDAVV